MGLLFRGIIWFGLFLAMTLAPLGIALLADPIRSLRAYGLELSVACGFIAFALFTSEFALVSRLRAATAPFGADVLRHFHRWMGLAALGFALALMIVTSVWRRRIGLSYERWQLVHLTAALSLAGTGLAHVLTVEGYSGDPLVRGTLIVYVAVSLALLVSYRVLRPLRLARRPWEIVANRDEGASTHTLVLRPRGHRGLEFEPGQFVWLITGWRPLLSQQHPISIASSAERASEVPLELTIKGLGDWSRETVPALQPGARVWLDGPCGAFTPDRVPGQGFVLLAGGIGITPLRSMLLTLRDRGDARPVLLFYGARNFERALFRRELEALTGEIALRIVWVLEEPPPDWSGERGRMDGEMLRRHLPVQFRRFQFFICGPPAMMDALLRWLGTDSAAAEREAQRAFLADHGPATPAAEDAAISAWLAPRSRPRAPTTASCAAGIPRQAAPSPRARPER